jgi:hypothetical protein
MRSEAAAVRRQVRDATDIALFAEPSDEGLVFPAMEGGPMRRSNFRRRVWEPATAEVGVSGLSGSMT